MIKQNQLEKVIWMWNQCDHRVWCCDSVAINKTHKVHIYIYIRMNDRIYSNTIIYSYTVNVNLMLICIDLSELVIYCKYAWKFSVFAVIYYICHICLYYTFFAIHSSLTYKKHMRDTPSLKNLVSAINLWAYQITLLDSIRGILRTQSSFYDEVLS